LKFDDVLGQETIIKILRRFVATKTALRQSYLFAGPFGSGKTTLGRIMARALLCESPTETGDPCDTCPSCRALLEGNSLDFVEVDAATNSGKDEIRRITEEIQYTTFSGRRRIYLFDESHQLSRDALDAMLKPLEENLPGSQDKKLVCIFCTTEPEKMRATILSRCASAFVVQPPAPEIIAKRLELICREENIPYEFNALVTMAEVTECHIRDAIKAVEGISMLGSLNSENVGVYLKLDLNTAYLEVLENIGMDLATAMKVAKSILERTSPATAYEKLADVALLVYQTSLGAVKPCSFWDLSKIEAVGKRHGEALLSFANRFASRPGRPTASMLLCDIGCLHHVGGNIPADVVIAAPKIHPVASPTTCLTQPTPPIEKNIQPQLQTQPDLGIMTSVTLAAPSGRGGGVHVDKRAVHKNLGSDPGLAKVSRITPEEFCRFLALRLNELERERANEANDSAGSSRRINLDSCGIESTGRGPG
jgi:DNA polymerase III subunit gamma/tau